MREHAKEGFYIPDESELGAVGKGGLFHGRTEAGGDERWSNEVAQRSSVLIFRLHLRTKSFRDVFNEHKRTENPRGSTCSLRIKTLLTCWGGAPLPAVPEHKQARTKSPEASVDRWTGSGWEALEVKHILERPAQEVAGRPRKTTILWRSSWQRRPAPESPLSCVQESTWRSLNPAVFKRWLVMKTPLKYQLKTDHDDTF